MCGTNLATSNECTNDTRRTTEPYEVHDNQNKTVPAQLLGSTVRGQTFEIAGLLQDLFFAFAFAFAFLFPTCLPFPCSSASALAF